MTPRWKPKKDSYSEALKYLAGRKKGEITSLKTPWERLNDASVDGLEWGSVIVIAARSGNFKTTIKDQIVKNVFMLNPNTNLRVMDWQLEMAGKITAIREFSSTLGKSYKYLCSAEKEDGQQLILSKDDYMRCYEYAKNKAALENNQPIDTIHEGVTVQEFETQVRLYMETHKDSVTGEYPNVMVCIDHTRLFVRAPYETEEEMIFNLSVVVTRLKNDEKYHKDGKSKLLFIILSQMNRNFEVSARHEDGKYANYPTSADIFGSDSIFQAAEIVLALNRPGAYGIKHYGPNRYVINDDSIMAWHFLKVRNGAPRLSFFRADGERFEVYETEPPPSALRKLPTMTPMQEKKVEEKPSNNLEPNTLFTDQNPNF